MVMVMVVVYALLSFLPVRLGEEGWAFDQGDFQGRVLCRKTRQGKARQGKNGGMRSFLSVVV